MNGFRVQTDVFHLSYNSFISPILYGHLFDGIVVDYTYTIKAIMDKVNENISGIVIADSACRLMKKKKGLLS